MNMVDELDFRPVDPFGFWPRKPSALVSANDTDGSAPDDYAFHTPYILQGEGPVGFHGRLANLTADAGELIVRVNEMAPEQGSTAVTVATETLTTAELLASGGSFKVTVQAKAGHLYAVVGHVAPGSNASASGLDISVGGQRGAAEFRQKLIAAREDIFCQPALFRGLYQLVDAEPTLLHPVSQACTVGQFEEAAYTRWLTALKRPMMPHRKQWEFVYILHSLDYHGAFAPGARGLGFGVGQEPLPALMAAMGCNVTATDLPPEDARSADWSGTNQYSTNLAGISQPDLIDDTALAKLVEFQAVDMTQVPDTLADYDFTWSSCALEHLGSIAAGLNFIERSIDCLRPGGVAVHTTELNLLSNDRTLDHEGTVLFRRRDFEEIAARLILKGHEVMPLNFRTGDSPRDDHIDTPPYSCNEHFKLVMSQYVTTSFGLIVRRKECSGLNT